jgi:hypothetical protein
MIGVGGAGCRVGKSAAIAAQPKANVAIASQNKCLMLEPPRLLQVTLPRRNYKIVEWRRPDANQERLGQSFHGAGVLMHFNPKRLLSAGMPTSRS